MLINQKVPQAPTEIRCNLNPLCSRPSNLSVPSSFYKENEPNFHFAKAELSKPTHL